MQSLAIWLLFFGCLPLSYLIFRVSFDWIAYQLLPKKEVLVEFESSNGEIERFVITGKTQKELYEKAAKAVRSKSANNSD